MQRDALEPGPLEISVTLSRACEGLTPCSNPGSRDAEACGQARKSPAPRSR